MILKYNEIVDYLDKLVGSEDYDFLKASNAINDQINSFNKSEIIEFVNTIHILPESFPHDSSQEKLFAKLSDCIVSAAFKHLGLQSKVLNERGNSADVVAQSFYHGYSLVADSKVFRLSRTAKNQKDFKVDSMADWKGDSNYAMIVCPYYQYPQSKSAIFEKSVRHNVSLMGFEHLSFLLDSGITENSQISLERLFNYPSELANELKLSETRETRYSRKKLDEVVLEITSKNDSEKKNYFKSFYKMLRIQAREEITVWEDKILEIKSLSHEEAVQMVIESLKIQSKIKTIEEFLSNDFIL